MIDDSVRLLMIPDLLGFWLTGEQVVERTNASTTGLLDIANGDWNMTLIDKLGLPRSLFPPLVDAGRRIGSLRADVAAEVGAPAALDRGRGRVARHRIGRRRCSDDPARCRVRVIRHLVAGRGRAGRAGAQRRQPGGQLHQRGRGRREDPLPAQRDGHVAAQRVDAHVAARRAIGGAQLAARPGSRSQHTGADLRRQPPEPAPPGDMPKRIAALCVERGDAAPSSPAVFARSILESLADAYAEAIENAERLSGHKISTVHIVGGGSQNALLCQLTADRARRRVLAGPVEATAIGNVLVQARAAGLVSGGLADLRALVATYLRAVTSTPRTEVTLRIALFITCLADAMFPEVGRATVRVLERLGH